MDNEVKGSFIEDAIPVGLNRCYGIGKIDSVVNGLRSLTDATGNNMIEQFLRCEQINDLRNYTSFLLYQTLPNTCAMV